MRKSLDYYLYDLSASLFGSKPLHDWIQRSASAFFRFARVRRPLEDNIRRIFSFTHRREASEGEIDSILKEMAAICAQRIINSYALPKSQENYVRYSKPELLPALLTLLQEGRGAILVTPHFGDEGMIFGFLASRGIPVTVMLNEARGYQWATDRLKTLRFIGLGEGALEGLKALRGNEALMLFGDLNYFPEGRAMEFFGAPFPPPHGIARMALAARAPILPVYSVLQGGRYHLLCDEPIRPDPHFTQEDIERRVLRSMEAFIGRYPSHWLVFHSMWDLAACEKALKRQLRGIALRNRLH